MKQISKIIALCMALFIGCAFTVPATIGTLESYAATKAKVKISKKKATIVKDKTLQLKVKGTKKKAKWSSSKKSVATVNKKGKVTAKKAGKATITAKIGKKKYKCNITVKNPTTTLSASKLTLTPGQKYVLKVSSNGKSNKVSWWTTHSSVASIDGDGVVTAKKGGTTTITATMNGDSKSCAVTVLPYQIKPDGMYLVGTDMEAGEYYLFNDDEYGAYFEITRDASGALDAIIANDNFNYNSIVNVTTGQYLKLDRCHAIPAAYASVSTAGEGMFKVGKDITAGRYQLVSTDSLDAYYEVDSSASHNIDTIVTNENFTGTRYITVQNGQYLQLARCKIVK